MKQKNSFNTSKKFNKHHHHEEFLLYKSINEKEVLCPSCNHPLGRHKITINGSIKFDLTIIDSLKE